jgi:hypothetical protein
MHPQALYALAHPVFDAERPITGRHYWLADRNVSACLTCNIGPERVRYAGGRPLWHLSLSAHTADGPVMVLRWGPSRWRRMEEIRDRVMHGCGTDEPWHLDAEYLRHFEGGAVSAHWRKPMRVDEISRMAPTTDVRARPGRP